MQDSKIIGRPLENHLKKIHPAYTPDTNFDHSKSRLILEETSYDMDEMRKQHD